MVFFLVFLVAGALKQIYLLYLALLLLLLLLGAPVVRGPGVGAAGMENLWVLGGGKCTLLMRRVSFCQERQMGSSLGSPPSPLRCRERALSVQVEAGTAYSLGILFGLQHKNGFKSAVLFSH